VCAISGIHEKLASMGWFQAHISPSCARVYVCACVCVCVFVCVYVCIFVRLFWCSTRTHTRTHAHTHTAKTAEHITTRGMRLITDIHT
jgi:hypothetical protein